MQLPHMLRDATDDQLLERLNSLVAQSNRLEADLVAHIGAVDERRLFARFAFSSTFAYCTQALHLSEARAAHRSKREIDELVAELSPRPDVAAAIRRLPAMQRMASQPESDGRLATASEVQGEKALAAQAPAELSPGRVATAEFVQPRAGTEPPKIEALSPARYKVQFTASAELRDKLERLTALMRAEVPSGDIAQLIEQAVTEKLARLEAKRFGRSTAPGQKLQATNTKPVSRHVRAAVRRAVYERDGDRCRFVDEHGRRCSEATRLEFHHRHPFAMGGDHSPENLSLLCSTHNRRMAEIDYGVAAIAHHRRQQARDE